jgi:pre-60S factor REI1
MEGDHRFSCSTCRLWLNSVDEQRAHFQTALHAFNVRRKVVNMVPVTQQQFDEKVAESAQESKESDSKESGVLHCVACNKSFKSQEMLEQHLRSKKHLKAAAGKQQHEVVVAKGARKADEQESEEGDAVEKRIAKGRRLGPLECLFSGHVSETPEENAEYMYMNHGFFIPDVEYLVDLPGLLSYLGDKV